MFSTTGNRRRRLPPCLTPVFGLLFHSAVYAGSSEPATRPSCTGDELATRRIGGRSLADPDLAALAAALNGAHPSKILVAGSSVTLSLMAGRFEHRGVVIADVAGGPGLRRLQFFH